MVEHVTEVFGSDRHVEWCDELEGGEKEIQGVLFLLHVGLSRSELFLA